METPVSAELIRLSGVTKRYPRFTLREIDLVLAPGRILGLVGPNGAGKSTLFRILMGLSRADAGRVTVLGRPMPEEQVRVKAELGGMGEETRLHAARSLRWHADLVRSFYPGWDESRARELARRFDLDLAQRAGEMSRGQAVKALLLLALARRPRLLLLDEPTAGLDPLARVELLEALGGIVRAEGLGVLFSSHLTGDLEALADDVAFLHGGRLVEQGTLAEVLRRARQVAGEAPGHPALPGGPGGALDQLFRHCAREVTHAA